MCWYQPGGRGACAGGGRCDIVGNLCVWGVDGEEEEAAERKEKEGVGFVAWRLMLCVGLMRAGLGLRVTQVWRGGGYGWLRGMHYACTAPALCVSCVKAAAAAAADDDIHMTRVLQQQGKGATHKTAATVRCTHVTIRTDSLVPTTEKR